MVKYVWPFCGVGAERVKRNIICLTFFLLTKFSFLEGVFMYPKWNSRQLEILEVATRGACYMRKGVLKNLANFTRKHLRWSFFLTKVQGRDCNFIKMRLPTQVLSCKICKIFKNTYFEKHLQTSVSKISKWCEVFFVYK